MMNLEALYAKDNMICDLPDTFGNLKIIKKLDLSGNELSFIPDSIGNLLQLTDLNLSKNQIQGIAEYSLENLENLVLLDLH